MTDCIDPLLILTQGGFTTTRSTAKKLVMVSEGSSSPNHFCLPHKASLKLIKN